MERVRSWTRWGATGVLVLGLAAAVLLVQPGTLSPEIWQAFEPTDKPPKPLPPPPSPADQARAACIEEQAALEDGMRAAAARLPAITERAPWAAVQEHQARGRGAFQAEVWDRAHADFAAGRVALAEAAAEYEAERVRLRGALDAGEQRLHERPGLRLPRSGLEARVRLAIAQGALGEASRLIALLIAERAPLEQAYDEARAAILAELKRTTGLPADGAREVAERIRVGDFDAARAALRKWAPR